MTEEAWYCLECGLENHPDEFECSNCHEVKPNLCDLCGRPFMSWRDAPRSKLNKYCCRPCYTQAPEE